jgi:hypothetical protein
MRRPSRTCGSSPRTTSSYAKALEIPNTRAASGTDSTLLARELRPSSSSDFVACEFSTVKKGASGNLNAPKTTGTACRARRGYDTRLTATSPGTLNVILNRRLNGRQLNRRPTETEVARGHTVAATSALLAADHARTELVAGDRPASRRRAGLPSVRR